jgi:two-component system, OmpR family, phosphate regulon sensor histidine kinase PhoR
MFQAWKRYFTVFLVTVAGLLLLAVFWARREVHEASLGAARQDMEEQARIVAHLLKIEDPSLDETVDRAAQGSSYRITVIDLSGRVVADSAFSGQALQRMENHAGREEFREARELGEGVAHRYSTSVDGWLLYSATRTHDGHGFVRLARPLTARSFTGMNLWVPLLAGLLMLATGFIVFFSVGRRMGRQMEAIAQSWAAIREGDLSQRVPVHSGLELGRLARETERAADRLQERFATLQAERNHFRTILRSMAEGVLVADTKGRIAKVNPAFMTMFRVEKEPVGRRPLEVVRNSEIQTGIHQVLVSGRNHEDEILVGDKVLLARFAPISEDQQLSGVVTVFHDITRLRRLENLRKEFVSNVSHELKTPLTSIKGFAETLLEESSSNPVHRDFLERIERNCQQLNQIIDDLFKLASLEGEDRRLEYKEIAFSELVADLQSEFQGRLKEKAISLSSINRSGHASFFAEPGYIKRVFHNLLDNALKYTKEGEIRVELDFSLGQLVFSVHDTGVGIPSQDLSRIFERFYRVHKDRSRQTGGSGIGLAIVKHIVQLHGGRVWAESEVGRGTAVYFTLPIADQVSGGG